MKLQSERAAEDGATTRVMRPAAVALLVYAFLLAIVQIGVEGLTQGPSALLSYDREVLGTVRVSHFLLALHVGWLVLMLHDLWRARSSPPGLRKGHLAGGVVGVLLALALVVWAVRLVGMLDG